MNCNLIFQLLSEASVILPDRLAQWVHTRWLEPHTRHCMRCRTLLRRLDRLDNLFRALPATEALDRVMSAPMPIPAARIVALRWPRYTVAGAAVSLVLAGALLIRVRDGNEHRFAGAPPQAVEPRRLQGLPTAPSGKQALHIPGGSRAVVPFGKKDAADHRPVSAPTQLAGASAPADVLENGRDDTTGARPVRSKQLSDSEYLNGLDSVLTAGWMAGDGRDPEVLGWLQRRLPPIQDDFVRVPFPQLASAAPGSPAVGDAARRYEEAAAVVDARLFQKVKLQLKGVSLTDFCVELGKQAGVTLRTSRGVQDEKVTVFVKETPARDVMREVARLFGYHWARSGEEGAYKYDLLQDLRSQLAEQEMRNRDHNAALLALDDAMGVYRPYLGKTVGQLKSQLETAKGPEQERLSMLVAQGGWGAMQLFQNLSPADVAALREGKDLKYGYSQWHRNRLPEEWKLPLLQANRMRVGKIGGEEIFGAADGVPVSEYPGASPSLGLKIDRSELGQLVLQAEIGVSNAAGGGVGHRLTLASGRSPSTAKAENAEANKQLRTLPELQRKVSLGPKPSCPRLAAAPEREPGEEGLEDPVTSRPHVTSADVWEEVHRATGLPIVADYYTHLHPVTSVTVEKAVLYDALCKVSDEMGLRWKKDGNFLLARSTSYFWDKLKEVPNRTLNRWQEVRGANGALSLDQALEIVALSDQQLDSEIVGKAVEHCWNIPEWGLFGNGVMQTGPSAQFARPFYRILAMLGPEQLRRALQPEGWSLQTLNGIQQQEVARTETSLLGTVIHAAYVPAGWYVWEPRVRLGTDFRVYTKLPVVAARTPAEALAAAQRVDATATREHIRRQRGTLAVWFTNAQGELVREVGKPRIYLQP